MGLSCRVQKRIPPAYVSFNYWFEELKKKNIIIKLNIIIFIFKKLSTVLTAGGALMSGPRFVSMSSLALDLLPPTYHAGSVRFRATNL